MRASRGAIVGLVVISVLIPFGLLAFILALDGDGESQPDALAAGCPRPSATTSAAPADTEARAEIGAQAPDFVLTSLDGCDAEQLSAHRGTPVVLTFFASWCHPCEEEMPLLETAHEERPDDFDVLAVTYRDLRGDARRFAERLGVTYPTLFDDGGSVGERYGVTGIPQTWFIDADGVVQSRVYGITSRAALDEPLGSLLSA